MKNKFHFAITLLILVIVILTGVAVSYDVKADDPASILLSPIGTIGVDDWNDYFHWTGYEGADWYLPAVYRISDDALMFSNWYLASAVCGVDYDCGLYPSSLEDLGVGEYKWRIIENGSFGYRYGEYVYFTIAENTPTPTVSPTATATSTPTHTPTATATPMTPVLTIVPNVTYGEYMNITATLGLCGVIVIACVVMFILLNAKKRGGI